MHNNLNVIIKIFRTIYLLCAVLFTYIPSEGVPTILIVAIGIMSLGSTKIENLSLRHQKISSDSNCRFSATIRPFFIKENGNILADPEKKLKQNICAHNVLC